eukprot:1889371-Rhodomonas_salina.1
MLAISNHSTNAQRLTQPDPQVAAPALLALILTQINLGVEFSKKHGNTQWYDKKNVNHKGPNLFTCLKYLVETVDHQELPDLYPCQDRGPLQRADDLVR